MQLAGADGSIRPRDRAKESFGIPAEAVFAWRKIGFFADFIPLGGFHCDDSRGRMMPSVNTLNPNGKRHTIWGSRVALFFGWDIKVIPPGGLYDKFPVVIISKKDAPAWRQPKPGRANPNRQIKAGTDSIHHPAEKRKEKYKK